MSFMECEFFLSRALYPTAGLHSKRAESSP